MSAVETSASPWQQYEQSIAQLLSAFDPGAVISHNQRITGRMSRTGRQVDVWAEGWVAGVDIRLAVECKRHARPVNVGVVDEFAGKLQDLGADRGILYSWSGFTAAAANRAALSAGPRIQAVEQEVPKAPHDGPLYESANRDDSEEPAFTAPLTNDLSVQDFTRFLADGEWIGY